MKKIVLLFLGIILLTGCNNNEKELCNQMNEIDLSYYKENENYGELASILQKKYDRYCTDITSDACDKLTEYIDAVNSELASIDKKIYITLRSEELWAICNDKYN